MFKFIFGVFILTGIILAHTVGFKINNQILGTPIDSAYISFKHVTPQGNDTSFIYLNSSQSISNLTTGGYSITVSTSLGSLNLQSIISKDTTYLINIIPMSSAFSEDTIRKKNNPHYMSTSLDQYYSNKIIEPGVKIYLYSSGSGILHKGMIKIIANGTKEDPIEFIGSGGEINFSLDDHCNGSKLNWVNFKGISNFSIGRFSNNRASFPFPSTDISNCKFDSMGYITIDAVRLFENNTITINQKSHIELYDHDTNLVVFHNCYFSYLDSNINPYCIISSHFFKRDWLFLSNCTVKGKIYVTKANSINSIIEGCNFTSGSYVLKYNLFYGTHIGTPPLGIGYNISVNSNGDSIDFYNNLHTDPQLVGCAVSLNSPARHAGLGNVDIGFNPDKTTIDSVYKAIYSEFKLSSAKNIIKSAKSVKDFSVKSGLQNLTIAINLNTKTRFSISCYDLFGRRIYNDKERVYDAGYYLITLNTKLISKGIYFVKIDSNEGSFIDKIIVTK